MNNNNKNNYRKIKSLSLNEKMLMNKINNSLENEYNNNFSLNNNNNNYNSNDNVSPKNKYKINLKKNPIFNNKINFILKRDLISNVVERNNQKLFSFEKLKEHLKNKPLLLKPISNYKDTNKIKETINLFKLNRKSLSINFYNNFDFEINKLNESLNRSNNKNKIKFIATQKTEKLFSSINNIFPKDYEIINKKEKIISFKNLFRIIELNKIMKEDKNKYYKSYNTEYNFGKNDIKKEIKNEFEKKVPRMFLTKFNKKTDNFYKNWKGLGFGLGRNKFMNNNYLLYNKLKYKKL